MDARAELTALIAQELAQPVSAAVHTMADAVRARHAEAALGVLFYGSCLRKPETLLADSLLDFYLLVDDYRRAYRGSVMAFANRVLPPNVFYLEAQHDGATLRCKYAVISLAQFQSGVSADTDNVSLWARFSQQSRVVWARDTATIQPVATACAEAVLTMLGNALPLAGSTATADVAWQRAFEETYRAEVRSEGVSRAVELVNADLERYRQTYALAHDLLRSTSADACAAAWRWH